MELVIPDRLAEEFATVHAVWHCGGKTRGVDALLLSWVKYEKQLRRLFCFLVFQHPEMTGEKTIEVVSVLVDNDRVFPRHLTTGIAALGVKPVPDLIGNKHEALAAEIARINGYRNKLMHGQVSGENISTDVLERDVLSLIEWIDALARGAHAEFGYDGLIRNTCRVANGKKVPVNKFPFKDSKEFASWLNGITHPNRRPNPQPRNPRA